MNRIILFVTLFFLAFLALFSPLQASLALHEIGRKIRDALPDEKLMELDGWRAPRSR